MSLTKIFVIVLLLMCFLGAEIKNSNEVSEVEFENMFENVSYDKMNFTFSEQSNDKNSTFLVRAVSKLTDFISFITIDGAKEAINYGYDNPQYNYGLAWKLLFITIFASLIIPAIYLLAFIGYFVMLIIKKLKKEE